MRHSGKYLVTMIFPESSKHMLFEELTGRVSSRIDGWKIKFLSQTGRTFPVISITSSIPNYQMFVFSIPKSIAPKLMPFRENSGGVRKSQGKQLSTSENGPQLLNR